MHYLSREWYTFNSANLYHRVPRVILYLKSPSIRSESAVYILNSAVPKITLIFVVLILLSPITISRYFRNFVPFFWYQHVPLTVAQHLHTFVLSLFYWLSRNKVTVYFVQAAINSWLTSKGNRGELSYKLLPSYTQHSVVPVSQRSFLALHFCVSS